MQTDEVLAGTSTGVREKPQQIASWGRLIGFLLIGVGVVVLGFFAQHASTGGSGGGSTDQLGRHSQAIPIYLGAILMDWALFYFCWNAVRDYGGNLKTLSGGRWTSWKAVAVDVAITLPFWALWEGAAYGVHWLLGASSAKSVDSLLPKSLLEVLIWIATSITAGVCEEIAFRGFLQRQLHALSGSIVVAVLAQGLVFGLFHSYQGWKAVVVISVLGVLYGALAAWRKNLRANMIAHAWSDVWEGWLKMVVWR
jgi:uncharacterized protein